MSKNLIVLILFIFSFELLGQGKNDSLTLVNGNLIVCEVIGLEKNRLQIDASYGYGKWEVKWHNVASIKTVNSYNIQLVDGQRFYGRLETIGPDEVEIKSDTSTIKTTKLSEIAYLMEYKSTFLERLEGSVSLGVNLTKARDFRQLNTANRLSYRERDYRIGLNYDALVSSQDSVQSIQRSDGSLSFTYDLPSQYFVYFSTSVLSNTEQRLDSRWSTQVGFGKLLISNNQLDWRLMLGTNYNSERFSSETKDRESMEGLLSTRFEIFNMGDLKFFTNVKTYYSFTEEDRFRADFKADLRYNIKYFKKSKLTNKIFIATSFTLNYDGKPASEASRLDYVFTTTLGISWND